jgi:hypothetical protein
MATAPQIARRLPWRLRHVAAGRDNPQPGPWHARGRELVREQGTRSEHRRRMTVGPPIEHHLSPGAPPAVVDPARRLVRNADDWDPRPPERQPWRKEGSGDAIHQQDIGPLPLHLSQHSWPGQHA